MGYETRMDLQLKGGTYVLLGGFNFGPKNTAYDTDDTSHLYRLERNQELTTPDFFRQFLRKLKLRNLINFICCFLRD
jgi:hypothetical protein